MTGIPLVRAHYGGNGFRAFALWMMLMMASVTAARNASGQAINYPTSTPTSAFTFNGDATPLSDTTLQLTSFRQNGDPNQANYDPNARQAGSFFFNTPVNVSQFNTTFRFRLTPDGGASGNPPGDGITFIIQSQGVNALGGGGSGLGYDGVQPSIALKFKTAQLAFSGGPADPSTSTVGVLVNGEYPIGSGIGLTDLLQFGSDFDLGAGAAYRANLAYANSKLVLTLTNEDTNRTITLNFAVNIPAYVGGNSALVGFSGATGLFLSDQRILSWQYTSSGSTSPVRPAISSISPASVAAGSASTSVVINGAGFALGTPTVRFDNNIVPVASYSSTQVSVTVPPSLLTTVRNYNVTVTVNGGVSNAARFAVVRGQTPTPAPSLQIVGVQRSGRDPASGVRFVAFLLRNTGAADITNLNFTNIQLAGNDGTTVFGNFAATEPGGTPPGSLSLMHPGDNLIVRFEFHTEATNGTVMIGGTSTQGNFNAGSRFVQF